MKKTNVFKIATFFLFLLLTISNGMSQTFGVKGGLNLSNMLLKDEDGDYFDDTKMLPGFHAGIFANIPISGSISFEPGLLLSTKGLKVEEEDDDDFEASMKLNTFYADVPLTLKYTYILEDLKIYGAAGPYVGIGISGKSKSTYTYNGESESEEETIEWGSDEDKDDLKRLDFGLTFGAGISKGSILAGISYDLGLANISPYTEDGTKNSNRVFRISIGYIFPAGKK